MSVGRNDPCPCQSGKKYKKCCLLKEEQAQANALKTRQELMAEFDAEWDTWFKNDQAVGQKNIMEATHNSSPNFAVGSEGEKLFNEMMEEPNE